MMWLHSTFVRTTSFICIVNREWQAPAAAPSGKAYEPKQHRAQRAILTKETASPQYGPIVWFQFMLLCVRCSCHMEITKKLEVLLKK